jgi:diacylglycerol kinase
MDESPRPDVDASDAEHPRSTDDDLALGDLAVHKGNDESHTMLASFGHAFAGLWYAARTQRNMRIHLAVALLATILGLYLRLHPTRWALLALTIGFVIVAELFNTVAEAAMDAATVHYHPLVKIAKDVAAGAVLLSAMIAVLVGLLVLGPPLWAKIVTSIGK